MFKRIRNLAVRVAGYFSHESRAERLQDSAKVIIATGKAKAEADILKAAERSDIAFDSAAYRAELAERVQAALYARAERKLKDDLDKQNAKKDAAYDKLTRLNNLR